jgi:uncharacterized membrane protein HdeD (DUF308 family)
LIVVGVIAWFEVAAVMLASTMVIGTCLMIGGSKSSTPL